MDRRVWVGALAATLVGLAGLGGGCTSSRDCCGACPGPQSATIQLACPDEVVQASATGACATPDGGVSWSMGKGAVYVDSQKPGACLVRLTFVSGFTHMTEITFASQSGGTCGACACGDIIAPMSGAATIDDSRACVAVGGAAGDGGADAADAAGD